MGRPGITKAQVAEAVSSLRAHGKVTTTRVVRLELGKGSYKTISKFLDELGAKSTGRPDVIQDMPEHIQRRFADATLSMWQAACHASSKTQAELKRQCERRVQALCAELAREREAKKRAERELSATYQKLLASETNEQHLAEHVAMLREQLAAEQAVLKHSERERTELLKRLGPAVDSESTARLKSRANRGHPIDRSQSRYR